MLISLKNKRIKKDNLFYGAQICKNRAYSTITKVKKFESVKEIVRFFVKDPSKIRQLFLAAYDKPNNQCQCPHILISSEWNGKWFPIIDADNEENCLRSLLWLEEQKFNYAVWESSPKKYWIIVDYYSDLRDAKIITLNSPGCDSLYQNLITERGFWIRGSYKLEYKSLPVLLSCNGGEQLTAYCNALEEYFKINHDDLLWLQRHSLQLIGQADLQDLGEPCNRTIFDYL